ncbi:DUF6463 family protein [Solicola gregarius]|uniref:DUF6463 family protein n=1 Tax=Solicola gregarius TaxID=2908642 RepID=A0AA46TJY7_9ACTN|nr:DUF6463 family protein [Solicola gregarius]UYM06712.1 DUF6463 family protein [Solicola gregarius]
MYGSRWGSVGMWDTWGGRGAAASRRAGRLCGPLLIATGIIHLAYGVVAGWDSVAALITDGIGSAESGSATRESWFWFLVAGIPMLLVGQLVTRHHARTGEVPAFLGWYLVAFAALVYFIPVSGFWLFWPQAALAFSAAYAAQRAPEVSSHAA